MKKTVLGLLVLSLMCINAFSQDSLPKKIKEIGFTIRDLTEFGVSYKIGNENTLFRAKVLISNGNKSENKYDSYSIAGKNYDTLPKNTSDDLGFRLDLGIEKRKKLSNQFTFIYGLEWINSYSQGNMKSYSVSNYTYSNTSTLVVDPYQTKYWNIHTGIGAIIGLLYQFNQSVSINVEVSPYGMYSYGETKYERENYSVSWKGNSTSGYTPTYYLVDKTTYTKKNKIFYYNSSVSFTLAYRFK